MKRVHPKQEVASDQAVPGTPEVIEPGASGDNKPDLALPFVKISFEQVLPAGVFVDFIKGDPRPLVPWSSTLPTRRQAEILDEEMRIPGEFQLK
jgi:hypothetical protein